MQEIRMIPIYSPTKNMPNFIPEYSEWKPATSSLSASGKYKKDEAKKLRDDKPHGALGLNNVLQVERAGHNHRAHHRQTHEDFITEHLRRGAQTAEQGVFAGRRPARKHHAVNAKR